MKKSKSKTPPATRKSRATAETGSSRSTVSRRDLITNLQYAAIGAAVLGGGGWFAVGEVCASVRDHDLSRIGQGVPTVVQIHDPQCPQCLALQTETQAALQAFDADELHYVIANIRSAEGRAFARSHGVEHVTLMLFDGEGRPQQVLSGPNQADRLERAFRRHLERASR